MESSATAPGKPAATKNQPSKAGPRTKKYKEPPKDRVDLVASSMQDVYSVADSLIGAAMRFMGKEYIDGLFSLDEVKAEKLARSLCQINQSLPALAERVNKVSAPVTFASVFISDLAVKGAILYGLSKQPRIITPAAPHPENHIQH